MTVGTIWFCLVAFLLTGYVILDGYDLGAGILHLWVARTDAERELVRRSIGPLWDGNEVWLVAGGGTLFFAFPVLYATSFSGFYLPLTIVLWLLVIRGLAIDLRGHLAGPVWRPFWDAAFALASTFLALALGTALGNVVRGVPLGPDGFFFAPLWTDFRLGPPTGIVDWYTLLTGATALAALALHGAVWLILRASGDVHERARRLWPALWLAVAALTALVTAATFHVRPEVPRNLLAHPWGGGFPAAALVGLAGVAGFARRQRERLAFAASSLYLAGMMASVAFGLHPLVLPARPDVARSLTVDNARAGGPGLALGLIWWSIAAALAVGYSFHAHRQFAAKLHVRDEE